MTGRIGRAGMSVILLILGILLAAAGIVAIGFGIPINEFNLGNTLIVAGTIAISAGLILVGLAAAVDQLTQIALALRPRAGARPVLQPQAAEPGGVRPGQAPGQVPDQAPIPVPARAPMPVAPRAPVFAQARAEDRGPEPAPAESVSAVAFSAIERLRSSLARPERKAGDATASDHAEDVSSAPVAPPTPAAPAGTNGSAPPDVAEARKKPPLDFLFRSKAREPHPEAFDTVWPKRGARRANEQADAGESARPAATEAPIERPYSEPPLVAASDDSRPAAILKSGVVDGMAYTLYADGSIEAQLPQGTVRFGSIAELRSHIENNS
jgi:hypothetical protein